MTEITPAKTDIQPKKTYSVEEIKQLAQYLSILGAGIYPLIRAMDGLPPEDDPTYGLINRNDPRETGMLSQENLDTHVAWNTASQKWPVLRMFEEVRKSDLPYEKTLDGKNWVLTAALVGKSQQQQGPSTQINMGTPQFNNPNWNPQTVDQNGNPQQGPPKKKKRFGLF